LLSLDLVNAAPPLVSCQFAALFAFAEAFLFGSFYRKKPHLAFLSHALASSAPRTTNVDI
jgi:hypothetical protein